jgi:hypothetical protein
MTPEHEALARRAVACPRWRWMPGMLVDSAGYVYRMTSESIADGCGAVDWQQKWMRPDLTDPATLGCLLALVREALGDPEVFARREIGGLGWVVIRSNSVRLIRGETEAEALVAALEAAP